MPLKCHPSLWTPPGSEGIWLARFKWAEEFSSERKHSIWRVRLVYKCIYALPCDPDTIYFKFRQQVTISALLRATEATWECFITFAYGQTSEKGLVWKGTLPLSYKIAGKVSCTPATLYAGWAAVENGWMDRRSAMHVPSSKNVLKFSSVRAPWLSPHPREPVNVARWWICTTDRRQKGKSCCFFLNCFIHFCVKPEMSELLQPPPHHEVIKRLKKTQLCSDSQTLLCYCRLLHYESITFYYATYHSYYMVLLLLHQSLYIRVCVCTPLCFFSLYPRCECLKKVCHRQRVEVLEVCCVFRCLRAVFFFFSEGGW